MIIDANANVGQSLYGPRQTVDDLLRSMDAVGIDRAVVSPMTPPDLDFRRANAALAARAARDDRLIGFARIDPRLGARSVAEVDACRDEGLRGVKVDPFEQGFQINSDLTLEVFAACADMGLPLLVVAGFPMASSPIQVGDLAVRLPSLTVVMLHGGQLAMHGLGIMDCLNVVRAVRNVFVETSGIPETGTESLIEHVVLDVSPTRVVFGTNAPVNDPGMELERIAVAQVPEDAKRQILGPNLARILER
jgi:predicted TIM-barrel fold metal-dependent hydrolase